MPELPGARALNGTAPADRADDCLMHVAAWFWVTRRVFAELGVAPNADDFAGAFTTGTSQSTTSAPRRDDCVLPQSAASLQSSGRGARKSVGLADSLAAFAVGHDGFRGRAVDVRMASLVQCTTPLGSCRCPRVWPQPLLVVYENFLFYTYGESFCVLLGLIAFAPTSRTPAVRTGIYACAATMLVGVGRCFIPPGRDSLLRRNGRAASPEAESMRRWLPRFSGNAARHQERIDVWRVDHELVVRDERREIGGCGGGPGFPRISRRREPCHEPSW